MGAVQLRSNTAAYDSVLRRVEDPNGIIVQLVQWVAAPPESVTH